MPAPNISVRKEGKWATTAVDKAYQDALAQVTRNSRVAYANLTYTEGVVQVGSVADAITELGSLADSVSCGFTSPTVHGFRCV